MDGTGISSGVQVVDVILEGTNRARIIVEGKSIEDVTSKEAGDEAHLSARKVLGGSIGQDGFVTFYAVDDHGNPIRPVDGRPMPSVDDTCRYRGEYKFISSS